MAAGFARRAKRRYQSAIKVGVERQVVRRKEITRVKGARRWADENFEEVFANGDDDELRALQHQLEMAALDEEMAEIQRYNDSLT